MSWYTLSFFSDILHRDTECFIAAPEQVGSDCRTVYLLHGGGGGAGIDHRDFLPVRGKIQEWAEHYRTVFVMPCAPDSFFCNSCEGVRYRDFVIEELIGRIQGLLPVSKDREMTAAAGMSMGGTSAFYLGLGAPEKIGWIGCFCSGNLWVSPLSNRVHRYALQHVFGVERIEDIKGTRFDIFTLAEGLVKEGRPLPHIFHACGQEDHGLVHAHETSLWFKEHGTMFDYTYNEPETGGHNFEFMCCWMEQFLQKFCLR